MLIVNQLSAESQQKQGMKQKLLINPKPDDQQQGPNILAEPSLRVLFQNVDVNDMNRMQFVLLCVMPRSI